MRAERQSDRSGPRVVSAGAVLAVLVGASALGSVTAASADPAPSATTVPVSFAEESEHPGRFYPTVEITLGSNPDPYTVVLDTGSTALAMSVDVPGLTATDAPAVVTYDGFSIGGTIAVGAFGIGGATASTVDLAVGPCTGNCDFGDATTSDGRTIQGVLGVGQALQTQTSPTTSDTYAWFSPLMQLDDTSLAEGFTLALTPTGGTLTLGAPTLVTGQAGVTSIPAKKAGGSEAGTYPTPLGYDVYEKPFTLCWQVESVAPLCQATTVDSGAPTGLLTGSQFDSLIPGVAADPSSLPAQTSLGALPTGTAIGLAVDGATGGDTAAGSTTTAFATWLTNSSTSEMHLYNTISDGHLNTGNIFFIDRTVGYHYETGRMLVQSNGTPPTPPATVQTSASDGVLSAVWADVQDDVQDDLGAQASIVAVPAAASASGAASAAGPTAASGVASGVASAAASASGAEPTTDRLVRVRDAASGAVVQRFNLPGSATSTTISGLTNGRSYVVDIASANRHGFSAYTSSAPAMPNAAAVTGGGSGSGTRLADTGLDLSGTAAIGLGLLVIALIGGGSLLARRRSV
ncbi:MAG: hypothetical protein EPO52_00070 [Herbiconiux sp.]|uniref:hypothetical protein n=1 Tax=Herbiconiux sp. TaxID=1871186 RepID=UPI0012248B1B|nr:hypothetical protein [Herbiconiux sp.]TAJ50258.1 MAG: hypothetical protein EPO52_00070 [Herbiconiux sp.]